MILNDRLIAEWAKDNVTPFNPDNVNPASLDLSWSGRYKVACKNGWGEVHDGDFMILLPNTFYLLDTLEYIEMPEWAVGKLFLKSSAGRKGIEHLHAGYIDPGFSGTITLELEIRVPWTITINKGDRLVQLTLEKMLEEPVNSYKKVGHYNGQTEPTEARA